VSATVGLVERGALELGEDSEWVGLSPGAADCVGSHFWLSRPPGAPGLPRAVKIIKAFAVPGYLPNPAFVKGRRACVRIAVLPRWSQRDCKQVGEWPATWRPGRIVPVRTQMPNSAAFSLPNRCRVGRVIWLIPRAHGCSTSGAAQPHLFECFSLECHSSGTQPQSAVTSPWANARLCRPCL